MFLLLLAVLAATEGDLMARLQGDQGIADDLAQETFLRAGRI